MSSAKKLSDLFLSEVTPLFTGKTIQVWEVKLWKTDPSNTKTKPLVSSSQVTLLCNLPVPENAKDVGEILKKRAKL